MTWNSFKPHGRHQVHALVMLLAGLAASAVIYLTSGTPVENDMVNEFAQSKRYLHDLELYGGKANLMASEFLSWFNGLWHGRALSGTVAFLTIVISLGYYFLAKLQSLHHSSDAEEEERHHDPR